MPSLANTESKAAVNFASLVADEVGELFGAVAELP
jgi:hypothetical protein